MSDTTLPTNQNPTNEIPFDPAQQNNGILDKTLGEVLHSNPQAQSMVMNAMHISPEKLQEMLQMTDDNPMMQTKIGDLFKNGTIQQAVSQQNINQAMPQQNVSLTPIGAIIEKIKKWLIR